MVWEYKTVLILYESASYLEGKYFQILWKNKVNKIREL